MPPIEHVSDPSKLFGDDDAATTTTPEANEAATAEPQEPTETEPMAETKPEPQAEPEPSPEQNNGKISVSLKEYRRIVGLLSDLDDAERECERAEAVAEFTTEANKQAKEALKVAEDRLSGLRAEIRRVNRGDDLLSFVDSLVVEEQPVADDSASGGNSSPAASDDAWRSISTAVLFRDPIKGCGQKKIDAILHEVPTLGKFEDLRVEAANKNEPLHKHLPKGVGADLANELEERLLSAITNPPSDDSPGDGDEYSSDNTEPTTLDEEAAAAAERDAIVKRASEISAESEDGEYPAQLDEKGYHGGGYKSRIDGVPITECPWLAGENQDDWLRGWLTADADETARESAGLVGDGETEAEAELEAPLADDL